MKHTATKILCSIAAVVVFFWGMMGVAQNSAVKEDATGSLKIVGWYLIFQSLLFIVLAVAAIMRITANKKTKTIQKGLYVVSSVVAIAYSLLLAINVAPYLASLFTEEFWQRSEMVMVVFEQILYLIQGILFAVLSGDMLCGKLKSRGELTRITTVCVAVLLIPYGFQFFGAGGLQLVLTNGAGLFLAVLTACQAGVTYAAFIPIEE